MIRHRVPAAMFGALAEGNGGPEAVRHLAAAEYSKNLLLVHGLVTTARDLAHPARDHARAGYELLARVQERAPEAVDAVLRYPSVGAWASQALLAMRGEQSRARTGLNGPAGLAAVTAAAAIRARFPCAIDIPVTRGVVTFPSLGQAVMPESVMATLRSGPGGAELVAGRLRVPIPGEPWLDSANWRGLRRIRACSRGVTLRLVVDDLDPHRMRAPSLATRLTEGEILRRQSALSAAWQVLRAHHWAVAEEIATTIQVLVPLQALTHRMRSATSREHFGSIGISVPSGTLEFAVSLAHEVQHAKLCALQEVVRLLEPDDGRRYYAPWRDDPRPIGGLLQGAYAYLGVARFWRRQRQEENGAAALRAHAEYARWRSAVLSATGDLMRSGRLTAAGQEFVSTMASVVGTWREDPVPAEAAAAAIRAASRHAGQWRLRHGSPG
jgi:HEXXH motif-containing protein